MAALRDSVAWRSVISVTGDPGEVLKNVAAEVQVFLIDLEAVLPVPGLVRECLDVGGFEALIRLIGTGDLEIDKNGGFRRGRKDT